MELVVLSQPACGPCTLVKNYLREEDIPFREIDIVSEPEAIEKYGVMGTPVTILMDDEEEIVRLSGFDEDSLDGLAEQVG